MAGKLQPGSEVYLEDGRCARLVASDGGEYVVRPIVESDDDEPWEGRPITVSKVWSKPPRDKYEADITGLIAKATELREQCSGLAKAKADFEREERERQERLNRHNLLRPLDDLLSGRATHVLIKDWQQWRILTLTDALVDREAHGRLSPLRVEGETWYYGDGRVRWTVRGSDVEFFGSVDEARAAAALIMERRYIAFRAGKPENHDTAEGLARAARGLGLSPPEDIAKAAHEHALAAARTAAADAKRKADEASAKVAALEAPAPEAELA